MDPGVIIKGLILVMFAALVVGLVCYLIVRLIGQFFRGFEQFAWIVYVIGGLVVLYFAWEYVLAPVL